MLGNVVTTKGMMPRQTTDLGVRGSTPLGRAKSFKDLEPAVEGHPGSSNSCGPHADLLDQTFAFRGPTTVWQ